MASGTAGVGVPGAELRGTLICNGSQGLAGSSIRCLRPSCKLDTGVRTLHIDMRMHIYIYIHVYIHTHICVRVARAMP